MAAGQGFKTFTTGEVLTAADVNGYLMQGINVFASSAARATAITSPQEGQYSFLKDTNALEYYDGAAWVGAPVGDITAVTAGKGLTGGGSSGDVTVSLATTAKGDLVAGSGASTAAVLTVGNNGETLVADSSASTGLRYQGSMAAGKNYLINGGFDIWQRGTSSTTNATYLADRWYNAIVGSTTVSQETSDLPTGVGVRYGTKYVTAGASAYATFIQALETATVVPMRGQTVTFSVWVKLTGGYVGSLVCNVNYSTSTDALASQTTNTGSANIGNAVDAATWVRKSLTFTVPSNAVGLSITLQPDTVQPSGVTVRIAAAQLELGSVPTTFSRAGGTIQGELAACQRYYYRNTGQAATANDLGTGWCNSTTNAIVIFRHPVTMRVAPTAALSAQTDFYFTWSLGTSTITASQVDRTSVDSVYFRVVTSGLTTGQGGVVGVSTGTTKYIEMSAEL